MRPDIANGPSTRLRISSMLLLASILTVAAIFALAGCSGASSNSDQSQSQETQGTADEQAAESFDPTGGWKIWQVETADGDVYHIDKVEEDTGLAYGDLHANYDFDGAGNVTATVDDVEYSGTYTVSGATLTMTFQDDKPIEMTYDSGAERLIYVDKSTGDQTLLKRRVEE